MNTPAQTPQVDVDEVQHPTLGPLKFPKTMPFDERNRMIEQMERASPTHQPSFGQIALQTTGKILKGEAQSWTPGSYLAQPSIPSAGENAAAGDRPMETFNPFHPIETAGYLVPQPVKNIVGNLRHGNIGAAGGEALPYGAIFGPSLAPEATSKIGRAMLPEPSRLYRSALKPPPSGDIGRTEAAIQTGLREKIPVSSAGFEKLGAQKDIINQQIASVLENAPEREINPQAVAGRMQEIEPTFREQVNPEADLAALQGSKQQFLRKHTVVQPFTKIDFRPVDEGEIGAVPVGQGAIKRVEPMTGPQAQAEKIGTYRQLKSRSYGELKDADREAQKTLARGLKEEIATQYPEISNLNARESRLLGLEPLLERAVQRIGNKDIGGIGTPLFGAGVKAATGSTGAAAVGSLVKSVIEMPAIKSRIAIGLANRGVPASEIASRLGPGVGIAPASISLPAFRPSGEPARKKEKQP